MLKGITSSSQLSDREVVDYIIACHVQATADTFIELASHEDGTFSILLDGAFCEWSKSVSREHLAITRDNIDYNILHKRF
jgi:hypothetical protein